MEASRKICEIGCAVGHPENLKQCQMKLFQGTALDAGLGGKQDATAIPTAKRVATQRACIRIPDEYEFATLSQVHVFPRTSAQDSLYRYFHKRRVVGVLHGCSSRMILVRVTFLL